MHYKSQSNAKTPRKTQKSTTQLVVYIDPKPPTRGVLSPAGLGEVHSMAVDWVGDNVYIADVLRQSVVACSLRSHHCVAVHDSIDRLGPLAVDSNNG